MRVQTVSEGWLYRNGFDPAFFDDTDMVECNMCTATWYYLDYEGKRCADCTAEREGEDNE